MVGEDIRLFTTDITSLCTVIPNSEGILVLNNFLLNVLIIVPCSGTTITNKLMVSHEYQNATQPPQSFRMFYLTPIFSVNTTAPNLKSTVATFTIVSALPLLPERSSLNL